MNDKPKLCVKCRNYRPAGERCQRNGLPGDIDLVTGGMPSVSARDERSQFKQVVSTGKTGHTMQLANEDQCDPEGKYWELLPGEDVPVELDLARREPKVGDRVLVHVGCGKWLPGNIENRGKSVMWVSPDNGDGGVVTIDGDEWRFADDDSEMAQE